ncbi:MAG: glycosyltransferase family 2 protein [Chitinophagaceae bacterium]
MNNPITLLSVIVPCYNEEKYVEKVLRRIMEVQLTHQLRKQILIVNDGSTDATEKNINKFINENPDASIQLINHPVNRGKGSSIKSALPFVTGQLIVIQDADLEYNPEDYNLLLAPIMEGKADVVVGSRFRGDGVHKGPFILHALVNKTYTFISNLLTRQKLSDIHSCYKMFNSEIIKSISIKENRFGVDPEVIAKLSHKKNVRIKEVGISYHGRNFSEGKKINFIDGFRAFYCIIWYNLFSKK